jgi:hypothetical protein
LNHSRPPAPLPALVYDADSSRLAVLLDGRHIANYTDRAPAGGVLVGLRVNSGRIRIDGFQPIYQVADRYETGSWCGEASEDPQSLIANSGYIVGNIQVSYQGGLESIRLKFIRVSDMQLERSDNYVSDWVGTGRGRPGESPSTDRPIVGIDANYDFSGIRAFGFYPVNAKVEQLSSDSTVSNGGEWRIWKSADGKYTVEARLSELDGSVVVLEKRDGTVVRVPLEKLGEADRELARAKR